MSLIHYFTCLSFIMPQCLQITAKPPLFSSNQHSPSLLVCAWRIPYSVVSEARLSYVRGRLQSSWWDSAFEARGVIGSVLWSLHNHISHVWSLFCFPSQGLALWLWPNKLIQNGITNWWTADRKQDLFNVTQYHPHCLYIVSFMFSMYSYFLSSVCLFPCFYPFWRLSGKYEMLFIMS